MTKDEVLKLALEALEGLFGIPQQYTGEGGGAVAIWRMGGSDASRRAIAVIKEALAQPVQPAQEPVALPCCGADASAVKWNPYNQVVQCHSCGQVYHPNRSQP